jgi:hypothetical protein
MAHKGLSARIEYAFLETDGDSKEGRKCILSVVALLPALFAWVFLPDFVDLPSALDGLFEEFINYVVVPEPNDAGAFDEDESNFLGGESSFVHALSQLPGAHRFHRCLLLLANGRHLVPVLCPKGVDSPMDVFPHLIRFHLKLLLHTRTDPSHTAIIIS